MISSGDEECPIKHHHLLTARFVFGITLTSVTLGVIQGTPATAAELAETIDVTGIVRDFRDRTDADGHPDVEKKPAAGFARYVGNISPMLGEDCRPEFTGGGHKIASQWRDAEHRPICRLLYDPALGDTEGNYSKPGTGAIESAATFDLWYRDEPGVNLSQDLTITLVLQPDGRYVFDDRLEPFYMERGGFFPIDDELFGNTPGNPDHNFHFTYELHLACEYDASAGQYFMFVGDDDVFVFVNGELVIDLGGVHAALDQYVDMNRLGLEDGKEYEIDFYFAERYRPQSNFRIETNIPVRNANQPSTTAAFD